MVLFPAYQKPALVPEKADQEGQQQWLAEHGKLRQELPEDETTGFIDGVHKCTTSFLVDQNRNFHRYGTKKNKPIRHDRCDSTQYQEDMTFNAEATIQFIQKIEKAYPTKKRIHIFYDNASYYRNKVVKKHLETSQVNLHFLPPYSPNLNPIERLQYLVRVFRGV